MLGKLGCHALSHGSRSFSPPLSCYVLLSILLVQVCFAALSVCVFSKIWRGENAFISRTKVKYASASDHLLQARISMRCCFLVKVMTRQAEAAPLTQITPGSGGVEPHHEGWDAFSEKYKTVLSHFGESAVTLGGCDIGMQS